MKFTLTAICVMMLVGCSTIEPAKTDQLILEVPAELLAKPEPLKKL